MATSFIPFLGSTNSDIDAGATSRLKEGLTYNRRNGSARSKEGELSTALTQRY